MAVYNFDLTEGENLDMALNALSQTEIEKGVKYLNKALELNPTSIEPNFLLASIYSDVNAYEFSNEVIFRVLPHTKNQLEKERFYILLAMNFAQMGDLDAASYYVSLLSDSDIDGLSVEVFEDFDPLYEEDNGFALAYPRTKDYYVHELDKAHYLTKNKMYTEAIKKLKQFKTGMPLKAQADHLLLVCYMLKEDFDRVIMAGTEMIKNEGGASLGIKCTLLTAYMFGGKEAQAAVMLDELLEKEYETYEDISVLLPILVNFARHDEIIKYAEIFLISFGQQPQAMLWLAQAKYNIGDKKGAMTSIRRLKEFYRTFEAADYYLELFSTNPKSVQYSVELPIGEVMERHRAIKEFIESDDEASKKLIKYDKQIVKLIKWVYKGGNVPFGIALTAKLDEIFIVEAENLLREALMSPNLKIPVFCEILTCLLKRKEVLDFQAVLEGEYIEVYFSLPHASVKLPNVLYDALACVIAEIVFGSEDYKLELDELDKLLHGMLKVKNDTLFFGKASEAELKKLKSPKTIAVTIFERMDAYADEDVKDIIKRLEVSSTTLKKYRKVLFDD